MSTDAVTPLQAWCALAEEPHLQLQAVGCIFEAVA